METTDAVLNKIQMDDIMDYDVFLSYPHADRAEVMQICEALRARELNVWMDESDIPDYASITRSIVDGLARSRVLLAYYSRNYSRSRACQWELTATFLAAQPEGDPRRRVLVVNPEVKWEHIQPVELKDAEIPNSDDLDSLASRVKARVDEIKGTIGEIHALKPPEWYGRKGVGSNRFVGRLHYMWQIHSALHASDFPIITDATAAYEVAQVHGMGGVGKSLLAEEYALRFAAAFPGGVFWLSAFGNDDVKAGLDAEGREAERSGQIRGIAAALGIPVQDRNPDEIEGALKWKLGAIEKQFLWVVDDLPAGMDEDTLQRWIAPHPLGKTLITTRTHEYGSLGNLIRLDVLEPDEAHELLTSWRVPNGLEEENAAHKLLKDLGYHALAVDVAGAAIRASISPTPFIDFVNALANPTEDELEFAKDLIGILPMGHETSIASTFLRSIKEVGSEGLDFLQLASMLAVAPIPASLVMSVFREADGLDEISGKRLATLAIHRAEELSLAERVEGDDAAFIVHTLISRTIRFRDIMPDRSGELRDAAVNVLAKEFRKKADDPQPPHELELAAVHARELVSRNEDLKTAALMAWIAQYDDARVAYVSAEKLWHRELEIINRILGDEHPVTLSSMGNLAWTLQAQGDYAGAREMLEQVLKIRRRILGEEHPDTLTSMGNLAEVLRDQGDLSGARKIQGQVLKIRRRILGDEHLGTLASMNNLAGTLQAQGDLAGAREMQEQVFEIMRRILGDEHLGTLASMNNLAGTLQAQGDLAGAREMQEQVFEIMRRILGDEHPDTLTSMGNLALMLRAQGDYAGARKIQGQVLKINRRILGDEHPDTVRSMNNLADTLHGQGDLSGARTIQEQVLKISRQIRGDEHPYTSISAWNLRSTLLEMNDSIEAMAVLKNDLLWLIDRDPAPLSVDQQKMREIIIQRIEEAKESQYE